MFVVLFKHSALLAVTTVPAKRFDEKGWCDYKQSLHKLIFTEYLNHPRIQHGDPLTFDLDLPAEKDVWQTLVSKCE